MSTYYIYDEDGHITVWWADDRAHAIEQWEDYYPKGDWTRCVRVES